LLSPLGLPCVAPPWNRLVAIDLGSGKEVWSTPLGSLEKIAGLPLELGAPGVGGPIVTAGGLVFIGATADEKFRAFDIDTGKKLWEADLPTSGMATPMTYEADGRQFIVIAAGGHQEHYPQRVGDYLVAFALPAE
jgi:quinoprotein glucose dehydrogenase